jgi:hypothetical protein
MTDTRHTEQIITEELIARAAQLGACADGLAAARQMIGQPIGTLHPKFSDWAARLFDGRSVLSDGTQQWYRAGLLHRDDGPALVFSHGPQEWYRDGLLHRDDGPAVTYPPRRREWWRDGKRQPDQHNHRIYRQPIPQGVRK